LIISKQPLFLKKFYFATKKVSLFLLALVFVWQIFRKLRAVNKQRSQ